MPSEMSMKIPGNFKNYISWYSFMFELSKIMPSPIFKRIMFYTHSALHVSACTFEEQNDMKGVFLTTSKGHVSAPNTRSEFHAMAHEIVKS